MKLKITVTKETLKRSVLCGTKEGKAVSQNCAIALAVRDIFPNAIVAPQLILMDGKIGYHNYNQIQLPQEATDFIVEFDSYKRSGHYAERLNMPELIFEVELHESIINFINLDELKPVLEGHENLELV